jgi:hypothetical protein
MMIETLDQLAAVLERMKPGECLELLGTFRQFWPRPAFYEPDDYLSCEQRARNWCAQFKCTVIEPIAAVDRLRFERMPDEMTIAFELCQGCVKPSECHSNRRCRWMLSARRMTAAEILR